jgi:hypothetical protein
MENDLPGNEQEESGKETSVEMENQIPGDEQDPIQNVSFDNPVEISADFLSSSNEVLDDQESEEFSTTVQDDSFALSIAAYGIDDETPETIENEEVVKVMEFEETEEGVKMPQPVSDSGFAVRVADESTRVAEPSVPLSPVMQRSRQHSISKRPIKSTKKIQFSVQLENIVPVSPNEDSLTPSFATRHDLKHEGQQQPLKSPGSPSAVNKIDMELPDGKKSTDYSKLDWALAKGINFPYVSILRFARASKGRCNICRKWKRL